MLSVLAVTTVLAFAGVACAQDRPQHAPTVQTCRADVALWYSDQINREYSKAEVEWKRHEVPNRTDTARLLLTEVDARREEMWKCWQVDYDQHDRYYVAATFYNEVFMDRCYRFIVRHNLLQQLTTEDEQGLR
jgi:hypothetical protein